MNNYLILRSQNSPYNDVTKSSVLSHLELDDNFIFLKGNVIYTATTDNGIVTLKKYNGGEITFNTTNDTYWTSGTTGINSLKTLNNSTIDATGNYALAEGYDTLASGNYSHAEGNSTESIGQSSHVGGSGDISKNSKNVADGIASFSHQYVSGYGQFGETDYGTFADYSAVLGGQEHYIFPSSTSGVIMGGNGHLLYGSSVNSGIFGGNANLIIDTTNTVVLGGDANGTIQADGSAIIAGYNNVIDAFAYYAPAYGFIGGGSNNKIQTGGGASDESSVIMGGNGNNINGDNQYNGIYNSFGSTLTSQDTSTIIGSYQSYIIDYVGGLNSHNNNIINASDSYITGYSISNTNILGGSNNSITQNTEGVYQPNFTTIINGYYNKITDSDTAVILNGFTNAISGNSKQSSILNGQYHSIISSKFSSIIGGNSNEMTDSDGSALIGGSNNSILSDGNPAFTRYYNAILGGTGNTIDNGELSFIMGGYQNVIPYGTVGSVILGGDSITANSNNTVFVQRLNIKYAQNDNLTTKLLTIDGNGLVKYRDVSSISGGTGGSGGTTVDLYWASGTTGTYSVKTNNGSTTDATGNYALAEGYNTLASGNYSHSEGNNNEARGTSSHSQNEGTLAKGNYSHAGGYNSTASGLTSFVHSYQSTAFGDRTVVLGGSGIAGYDSDTVYVPNLNINTTPLINNSLNKVLSRESNGNISEIELSSLNTIYSGTHETLTILKNENKLITGNKYILTDYQTKYIINGSDSSTRQQLHTVIGSAGNYTQFNNVPSTIAANGDVVTVVYAPSGSTVTTGQTFTIVDYFNFGYIRFSPTLTGVQNIGVQFKFEKQRYSNIPNDIIINDTNSKPVFKPSGVLNTEVHDGLPYMSMLGVDNPAPFTEQLSLTAIDSSNFSINAESLTFIGDKLEYDFNDTIIYDDNGNFKDNKNGTILKRENVDGTISINKDWRVQRYRRFQMDDFNWNGFLHKKEFSELSGTSGSTIYKLSAVNYCTNNNPTISLNHRYIMSEPSLNNFYTDFAKSVSNPFISGTTSAPLVSTGTRLPVIGHVSNFSVNVVLPLSGLTGTTLAKDFHIIPIISGEPKELVLTFKVNNLYNSVFLDFSQRFGVAGSIFVDSINGYIYNSSLMTDTSITNTGTLDNFISIDNLTLKNNGTIINSNILGSYSIENYGKIINTSFGQGYVNGVNEYNELNIDSGSIILDSIFGGLRGDGIYLNNFMSSQNLIINKTAGSSVIGGNTFLTLFKNANSMYGSEINLKTFTNQIPNKGFWGYVYDFDTAISDRFVNNFNTNKNLIYQNIDSNNITSITTITTVK